MRIIQSGKALFSTTPTVVPNKIIGCSKDTILKSMRTGLVLRLNITETIAPPKIMDLDNGIALWAGKPNIRTNKGTSIPPPPIPVALARLQIAKTSR
ncbi:hypothetical protein SteCoe_13883 [Stentor coeruleus]|uniref:Uncharacterized protein n=1 Tax=Stentor coeruleus TaxID=5963 RepID=A0A1R2C7G4_9CILI|nr:hypothetical protein SteCoe_13883 [Stentor coeruleus]